MSDAGSLSRRERQIMDALYRLGSGTAAQVRELLPDAPTTTAVRTLLRILEEKGHVARERDEVAHVYRPATSARQARRGALQHVLDTFFEGSPEQVVATLLELPDSRRLGKRELERLARLIEAAKKEGR